MTKTEDYKKAYERQKLARERAEHLLEVRSRELYDANKKVSNAYNRLNEQKAEIVQQEKLASIGLLAAGIAHEINNPVGFVKSNLQTLEEYSKYFINIVDASQKLNKSVANSEISARFKGELDYLQKKIQDNDFDYIVQDSIQCIEESLEGIERIEAIVINLREYSRSSSDERELLQPNELIEDSLKLLRNELKYDVDVIKEIGDIPKVWGSYGHLQQVIINILVNALQSLENKGVIIIRTYSDMDNVFIEIEDNGPGIPKANMSKVFDPFFTTKDVGKGTGLGLHVSHGIIASHGGELSVENSITGGACFRFNLPIDIRTRR
jgi:two-component system NtrC family sensor kinase